jgi:hypothetical protein
MLRRPSVSCAGAMAVLNPRQRILPRDTGVPGSAAYPRVRPQAKPPLPSRPRLVQRNMPLSIRQQRTSDAWAGLSPKAEQDWRSGTSATQAPSGSDQNKLM